MSIKKVRSKRFAGGYGYKIDFRRPGHKRIRKVFETKKLAQDVLDALSGDHVRRQYNIPVESHISLGELMAEHLKAMKKRGRDHVNTVRAATILERFRDLMGEARLIETIKTADLNKYVEARYDAGLQPQSINRELVEIKSCLSAAPNYFSTLDEDWRSPRAPWQEEPEDGRRQTWSEIEREKVLAELYGPRRPREQQWQYESRVAVGDMFTIAIQTGLRAGEVRKLNKAQLNLSTRMITVKSKKGVSRRKKGKTREVPMTDEVYEILERRGGDSKSEWVFPNRRGDGPMSDHLKAFKHACARAGIDYGAGRDGALIFNDARRTAENDMLDAGHTLRAVSDILGHSAKTALKHYARSTREQRRAAVNSLKKNGQNLTATDAPTAPTAQTAEKLEAKKASG